MEKHDKDEQTNKRGIKEEDYEKVYNKGDRKISQLIGMAVKKGYIIGVIVIMYEIGLIRTF